MTRDLELVKQICWKVSDFIATRSKNDQFGIFERSRASKADVYSMIEEYPTTFISPPKDAYDDLNILEYDDGITWFASIPLWSKEEGRSDMHVMVTIILDNDAPPRVELNNCRVP
jgi:hypothetical protein